MRCLSRGRLAAAASGEDADAELHADDCPRCRAELDAMAALVARARRAAVPTLSTERRMAILAGAMVAADGDAAAPPRSYIRWVAAIAITAGVLVALGALLASRDHEALRVAERAAPAAREPAAAPLAPLATPSAAGSPRNAAGADRELSELPDGPTTIDARATDPVRVAAGDTVVQIAGSKAVLTADRGVVTMVRVFAGSVDVAHGGRHEIITTGGAWIRPAVPAAEASASAASLHAFEQGWLALRGQRYREAIAAFDRARAPVIAEDAAYWAAIASQRAGEVPDAIERLRGFVARFPHSAWADDARRALIVLAP